MNTLTVIIITVVFLIVAIVLIKRRAKKTGGSRYTLIRVRGGQRQVYDTDTCAWVIMAVVISELDFNPDPYVSIDNSSSDSYSSSDSSSYDSGSDCSGGSDSGGYE